VLSLGNICNGKVELNAGRSDTYNMEEFISNHSESNLLNLELDSYGSAISNICKIDGWIDRK